MLCVPGDALLPEEFAEYSAEDNIRAMAIAGNIAYLVRYAVIFKHWLKALLLLSSTMASRAI